MTPAEALQRLCTDNGGEAPLRVLLVVAHPDDDIVGCGARLWRLGPSTRVAFVTDGAPHNPRFHLEAGFASRDEYAAARRNEARSALGLVGVPEAHIHELGIADQSAASMLAPLARRIAELVERLTPEAVLTHAYEGGHPDHDAVAFGVHAAERLARVRAAEFPTLLEFASYHEWAGKIATHAFLPNESSPPIFLQLTAQERLLKRRLFDCHASQHAVLEQFTLDQEGFRIAPAYDFSAPPAPSIFYEQFDWGMQAERFCSLARSALAELGL
jgi:N-acetylglucosamine malate deacetylase 2